MPPIRTTDFARAISKYFQTTDQMVREWCETGLLPARRNPARSQAHYIIMPGSIRSFLSEALGFTDAEIVDVYRRLNILPGIGELSA